MTTENFTVPQMEMYIKLHTDLIDVSQKNLDNNKDEMLRLKNIRSIEWNQDQIEAFKKKITELKVKQLNEEIKKNKEEIKKLKKLKEFMTLLKSKNRKEINKWKNENFFIKEIGVFQEKVCNDFESITCLLDLKNYTEYFEFDEDNEPVKWKSQKKKKEFFDKF